MIDNIFNFLLNIGFIGLVEVNYVFQILEIPITNIVHQFFILGVLKMRSDKT